MAWRVGLDQKHVYLWRQLAWGWLVYIAFGLILGAHLKPRPDEIAFMLVLPLAVLVPYAILCFGLALLRVLWPFAQPRWRRRRLGLQTNQRLGAGSRR